MKEIKNNKKLDLSVTKHLIIVLKNFYKFEHPAHQTFSSVENNNNALTGKYIFILFIYCNYFTIKCSN